MQYQTRQLVSGTGAAAVAPRIARAVALTLLVLAAVSGQAFASGQGEGDKGTEGLTPSDEILVSPEWVKDRSDDVVILEHARGREKFSKGHVPGAVYVPREVTWDKVDGLNGMLPAPETVAADLGGLGVSHDKEIVVYDGGSGLWASRLFWALEYLGHSDVHLLDGGLKAWKQAGYEVSTEVTVPERADFEPKLRESLLAEQGYIEENIENEDFLVIDTRSREEYVGEEKRSARNGHIPGAVNVNWTENLPESKEASFRPVSGLASVYQELLEGREGPAVTLCQTGVRGAHTYVALRVLGHEDARLYDGSWEEWGNAEDTPIAGGQSSSS
jgi:thiosulfate/3-mercaptopyruvate sulfurtransferase